MNDIDECLKTLGQILWRCVLLGFILLFVWAAALWLMRDVIYAQGAMFGLNPHECDLVHYGAMGLVKCLVLVFFLFPYIAVRMVLGKRKAGK